MENDELFKNGAGTTCYSYVKGKSEFLPHIVEKTQFSVLNVKD